jgi:hypothetical protein
MKDPCDDCLVQVNCSEACWEKKNYITLVRNAYDMHTSRNTGYSNPNKNVTKKIQERYYSNQIQLMKIIKRRLK